MAGGNGYQLRDFHHIITSLFAERPRSGPHSRTGSRFSDHGAIALPTCFFVLPVLLAAAFALIALAARALIVLTALLMLAAMLVLAGLLLAALTLVRLAALLAAITLLVLTFALILLGILALVVLPLLLLGILSLVGLVAFALVLLMGLIWFVSHDLYSPWNFCLELTQFVSMCSA
jgi:hypothetical protein